LLNDNLNQIIILSHPYIDCIGWSLCFIPYVQ